MDNPWIIHGLSMDYQWILLGFSMDYPWMIHGLSMDNCAITRSIKVPYLPSDKKITRSTLNSKIDKVPWRKVASTFLGPATVSAQVTFQETPKSRTFNFYNVFGGCFRRNSAQSKRNRSPPPPTQVKKQT